MEVKGHGTQMEVIIIRVNREKIKETFATDLIEANAVMDKTVNLSTNA